MEWKTNAFQSATAPRLALARGGRGGHGLLRAVRVALHTRGVSWRLPVPVPAIASPGRELLQAPDRGSHWPATAPLARLSQTPGVPATSERRG